MTPNILPFHLFERAFLYPKNTPYLELINIILLNPVISIVQYNKNREISIILKDNT